MANRFAKGRPMAALVLLDDERSYLERQVRRHRVARSLSERCRIILACAEGEQSKVVAERVWMPPVLQGDSQTFWRRGASIARVSGLVLWPDFATGRYAVRRTGSTSVQRALMLAPRDWLARPEH